MTRDTSIQTHDVQNIKITKKDYTDDDSTGRRQVAKITVEGEDDTIQIAAHGKNTTIEVIE